MFVRLCRGYILSFVCFFEERGIEGGRSGNVAYRKEGISRFKELCASH